MLQSALTVSCVKGHLAKKQQQTRSQVKVSSLLAMPLVDLVNVAEHDLLGAFETVGFGDVTVVDQLHVALSVCTHVCTSTYMHVHEYTRVVTTLYTSVRANASCAFISRRRI